MIEAPPRSRRQRIDALERANQVRRRRADLRRDLRRDPGLVLVCIAEPPEWLGAMKLADLVCSVPGVGPILANRWLRRARVPWVKTVGGLSQRQRGEVGVIVAAWLDEEPKRQRRRRTAA